MACCAQDTQIATLYQGTDFSTPGDRCFPQQHMQGTGKCVIPATCKELNWLQSVLLKLACKKYICGVVVSPSLGNVSKLVKQVGKPFW